MWANRVHARSRKETTILIDWLIQSILPSVPSWITQGLHHATTISHCQLSNRPPYAHRMSSPSCTVPSHLPLRAALTSSPLVLDVARHRRLVHADPLPHPQRRRAWLPPRRYSGEATSTDHAPPMFQSRCSLPSYCSWFGETVLFIFLVGFKAEGTRVVQKKFRCRIQ